MKYVHTNIIAKDWKRLAGFYQDVLQCVPVPPERDLSGDWVDALTCLEGVRIRGAHLRLPGWGEDGPTLEIFQYDHMPERPRGAINTQGFVHIAFQVDDVAGVAGRFLEHGGTAVGQLVSSQYPNGKTLVVQYVADPEGNIVELQAWKDTV